MADLAAGADAFRLLAENLRQAGETELVRALSKAVDDAARPVLDEVRTQLPEHMPDRYARVLGEDLRLSLSKRTTRDPGVTLRATTRGIGGRRRIRRLNDQGVLWHTLFGDGAAPRAGHRKHWYPQTSHVKEGFFTGPPEHSAPRVRDELLRAMRGIADQVTRKA